MTDRKNILTPVGRLVGGSPFLGQTKDAEGRPLVTKSGPNQGQPRVDFYMALAIPKTDPGWPALQAEIVAAAHAGFPHLIDAAGNCSAPTFAWKYTDGDSQQPNLKGRKPCDREGYPGHWVLSFSSGFAPQCYTAGGGAKIVDEKAIKRGDYVRISGTVAANGSTQQPGIYLNHSMLELVGYGEEIRTGPDASQVFGGAPAALPAGASPTPVAPATTIAPGGAPGGVPSPMAGVQPAPDFLNNTPTPGAPAAQPAPLPTGAPAASLPPAPPAPAPAPPVKMYLVSGVSYTAEQLLAAGWTQSQLDQHLNM